MEKVSTIFINNLPPNTIQEELIEKFNEYGAVKDVRLLRSNNGELRGYAFLDYNTEEEANRAINEGNDTKFHGYKIKVERTRRQLGDPPRFKHHLRDRPPLSGGGIASSQSASYVRRREDSPLMQSSPPRNRNIIYGQNYSENSPPRPQQYRPEAFVHKVSPNNGYSNIPQYPPPYRYRDSPPPRYRSERDYPYEPRRYVDRDYEIQRDYSYRDRDRRNPRDRMMYRDSPPQQPPLRRIRDDYPYDPPMPQGRNGSYRDHNEDSPPVHRRIIKDDSPPPLPRRILDDDDDDSPLPPRRIIADDDSPLPPPPRRIIDDDSDSPPPKNSK